MEKNFLIGLVLIGIGEFLIILPSFITLPKGSVTGNWSFLPAVVIFLLMRSGVLFAMFLVIPGICIILFSMASANDFALFNVVFLFTSFPLLVVSLVRVPWLVSLPNKTSEEKAVRNQKLDQFWITLMVGLGLLSGIPISAALFNYLMPR